MFDWVSGERALVRSLRGSGQPFDDPASPLRIGSSRVNVSPTGEEIGIQRAAEPLATFKFITHIAKAKAGLPI